MGIGGVMGSRGGFMPQGISDGVRGFHLGNMAMGGQQLSHAGLLGGGTGRGMMNRTGGGGGVFLQGARLSPATGGGAMMELVPGGNGLMRPMRADYSGQNHMRPSLGAAATTTRQQHYLQPGYQLGGFTGRGVQVGGVSVSQGFTQSELNAALVSGGFISMPGGCGAATNFQLDLSQAAAAASNGGAYGPSYQAISSGLNHSLLSSGGYGLRIDPSGGLAACEWSFIGSRDFSILRYSWFLRKL